MHTFLSTRDLNAIIVADLQYRLCETFQRTVIVCIDIHERLVNALHPCEPQNPQLGDVIKQRSECLRKACTTVNSGFPVPKQVYPQ